MSASLSGFAALFEATEDGHWDNPTVWGKDFLIPGPTDTIQFAAGSRVLLDHSAQITAIVQSKVTSIATAPFTITGADTVFNATGTSQFYGGTWITMYVTDAEVKFNNLEMGYGGYNNFYFDHAKLTVVNWGECRGSLIDDGSIFSFKNGSAVSSNKITMQININESKGALIFEDSTLDLTSLTNGNLSVEAQNQKSNVKLSAKNSTLSVQGMLIVKASAADTIAHGILDNTTATFNATNPVEDPVSKIKYGGTSVEAMNGGIAKLTIANGTVLNTKGIILFHQANSSNLLEIYGKNSAIVSTVNAVANSNSDTQVANNVSDKAENSSTIFSFGGYDANNKFQAVSALAFSNEANFVVNKGGTLRYILAQSNLAPEPQELPILDANVFKPLLGNFVIDLTNIRKLPAGDYYAYLLSSTESIENAEGSHDWDAAFARSEIIDSLSDPEINATFLDYEISADGMGLYIKINVPNDDVLIDILSQPQSSVLYSEETASLSVEVDAYAPVYQWQRSGDKENWTDIEGANEESYVLENSTADASGWYRCVITNGYDEVASEPALLTVHERVKIISVSPVEYFPTTTSIAVDATGYDLNYQWEETPRGTADWVAVEGATDATLILPPNSYADKKMFRCKVGNTSEMANQLISDTIDSQCTITINSVFEEITEAYNSVSFELAVDAESLTPLKYAWYSRKTADDDWKIISSQKKNKANFKLTTSSNGMQYKCVVSDDRDSLEFFTTVDVQPKATIKIQPKATTGFNDKDVVLSISAIGRDLKYQWQIQVPDPNNPKKKIWIDIEGANSAELTLEGHGYDLTGTQYRCLVWNTEDGLYLKTSKTAKITVKECAKVVTHPEDSPVKLTGESATFSCLGGGYSPKYQWEVKYAGSSDWEDIAKATSKKLKVSKLLKTQDQAQYRCRIYNGGETVWTNPAKLTVRQKTEVLPAYTKAAIWNNETGSIVVNVKAEGGFTYKWYVKVKGSKTYDLYTGTGGSGSSDLVNTDIALPMAAANAQYNGAKFKLEVTGKTLGTTVTSSEITLVFTDKTSIVELSTHLPEAFDQTAFAGLSSASYNATFAIKATGLKTLKYQWQESANGTTNWTNIQGAIKATYTIKNVPAERFGKRFRCQVTNAGGTVTTSTYTLLKLGKPAVASHPVNLMKTAGEPAVFTVTASAASGKKVTYQWYSRKSSTEDFAPIKGATKATYSIASVTTAMNNTQFRCVLSNATSVVDPTSIATSNTATLRVNAALVSQLSASASSESVNFVLDEIDELEKEADAIQYYSPAVKESAKITKGLAKMLANGLSVVIENNEIAVDKYTALTLLSGLGGDGAEFFWSVSYDGGITWLPLDANAAHYSFIAEESAYFKCVAILGEQSEEVLFKLRVK